MVREAVEKAGGGQGQKQDKTEPRSKNIESLPAAASGKSGGNQPGEGSLDAGGTDGKSQGIQRYGQLVNPDLLRTNGAGEEYLIEEAEDPAGQTGCG